MKKLTKQQIEELIIKKNGGTTLKELTKEFNISISVIYYHTNPEYKKRCIEYHRRWFNKLPLETKEKIKKSQREYQRVYHKERYTNDPVFRSKQIERVKRGNKK